jgi:DNA polymerase III delta prime subunit
MIQPSKFIPARPEDFVGTGDYGAHTAAHELVGLVNQARANHNSSLAVLINGRPGIGKSALCRWFIHDLLGCGKFSIIRKNGSEVDKEFITQLAGQLGYRDLYSEYKAIWIEECDLMSLPAQGRSLTYLDDLNESTGTVFLCTSNCKLADFEPRFSSRFNVFELQPPTAEEIEPLLARWLRHPEAIRQIARLAAGNVRAALKDADRQFAAENP